MVGQAAKPQALAYNANMTLLDVMIAVGGLAEFAAGNRAVIVRQEGDKQMRIPVRISDLIDDGDISRQRADAPGRRADHPREPLLILLSRARSPIAAGATKQPNTKARPCKK